MTHTEKPGAGKKMTTEEDLVARLRARKTELVHETKPSVLGPDPLLIEAADEIERLRAYLATYSKDTEATENRIIDAEFAATKAQNRFAGALAEIARLRATFAGDRAWIDQAAREIKVRYKYHIDGSWSDIAEIIERRMTGWSE